MRLVDATTYELVSFADDDQVPSYAALSHTWAASPQDEVSFQDMCTSDVARRTAKPGWAKIEGACAQARKHGCDHVWIDTCCIDKSSSAELQETINSMFRWYAGAALCLAFLSDVPGGGDQLDDEEDEDEDEDHDAAFGRARWFTRGWTLQELLAPMTVLFFNRDWEVIGSKESLSKRVEAITGIPSRYLCSEHSAVAGEGWAAERGHERFSDASVAERMSWAARRQTTRREDMAYCLLGLFGVCLPMLYGEGDRAFARLQEEIMRETDDCTLLSWGYGQLWNDRSATTAQSILAPSPAAFERCRGLVPSMLDGGFARPRFSLGQRGLALSLPVRADGNYDKVVYAILACGPSPSLLSSYSQGDLLVAIPLISVDACASAALWKEHGEYLRYSWCAPALVTPAFLSGAETRNIVIRRPSAAYERLRSFPIRVEAPRDYVLVGTYPPQPTYPIRGTRFENVGNRLLRPANNDMARRQNKASTQPQGGGEAASSPYLEEHRRRVLFHIKMHSLGNLLVSVEFDAAEPPSTNSHKNSAGKQQQQQQAQAARCQVFRLPSSRFDLQLLHDWSANEDGAAQLDDIPATVRPDKTLSFRVNGRNRRVLAIQAVQGHDENEMRLSIFGDEDWSGA